MYKTKGLTLHMGKRCRANIRLPLLHLEEWRLLKVGNNTKKEKG